MTPLHPGHTFAESPQFALDDYCARGLHVEPELVGAELCEELIATANVFSAVQGGDYRTALQPHRRAEVFMRALRHPRVAKIMRQILGGDISGIQTQFFYCKPGTPGFQPHQDNRFVNAPQGAFASVWIALTDVNPRNGCLYIYPESHHEPLLDIQEVEAQSTVLQDLNALRLRCVIPDKYQPIDLTMSKGDGAFFDGHTIHGSHANESDGHRYALLMTYIRRGVSFIPGRYAQREEVPIE